MKQLRLCVLSALFILSSSPRVFSETSVAKAVFTSGSTQASLVDNFNDGDSVNLWGGAYGEFVGPSGAVTMTHSDVNPFGGSGKSLSLQYDLPKEGGYGGLYITLDVQGGMKNLSGYKSLDFFVRGSISNVSCKIELKNKSADAAHKASSLYINDYLDGGITTDWKKVQIPLDAFVNLDSLSNVNELVFVFEHDYNSASGFPNSATLFLDDVSFKSLALPSIRIDSFGDAWGLNALGGNTGDFAASPASHQSTYSNVSGTFHNFSHSLSSIYNVSPSGSYVGIYFILGGGANGYTAYPHNFSGYSKISFWMKGNSAKETPKNIKIEIVDKNGTRFAVIPNDTTTPNSPLSTQWKNYVINFSKFLDSADWAKAVGIDAASIQQVNIVYEDWRAVNKTGKVFYDEIEFIK